MSILLIIAWASMSAYGFAQEPGISVIAVYEAVLEHATPRYPSRPGLSVVISERSFKSVGQCGGYCVDTAFVERKLAAPEIEQLKRKGLIAATCIEPERTMGCARMAGSTFIRLGVPYRVRADLRVLPGDERPNAIVRSAGAEDRAQAVDVGIDVLVWGPCPPERSPCEWPDIVLFTYLLEELPDRSYTVVTRIQTGGV